MCVLIMRIDDWRIVCNSLLIFTYENVRAQRRTFQTWETRRDLKRNWTGPSRECINETDREKYMGNICAWLSITLQILWQNKSLDTSRFKRIPNQSFSSNSSEKFLRNYFDIIDKAPAFPQKQRIFNTFRRISDKKNSNRKKEKIGI